MNISKFLLIDILLVVTAISLLSFLQVKNINPPILRNSKKEDFFRKNLLNLPNKEKLLNLEKIAKAKGSEIKIDSLIGNWKFKSIWKKDNEEEDSVFSSLLRIFSAEIEFKNTNSKENSYDLSIVTSIRFGLIFIEFSGFGCLKGEQPFVTFFFNLIELKLNKNVLLRKTLREPEDEGKSYFELISLEKHGEWLSARGQGGSLILWLKA